MTNQYRIRGVKSRQVIFGVSAWRVVFQLHWQLEYKAKKVLQYEKPWGALLGRGGWLLNLYLSDQDTFSYYLKLISFDVATVISIIISPGLLKRDKLLVSINVCIIETEKQNNIEENYF